MPFQWHNRFWQSFGGTVLESSAQSVYLVVSLSHQDYSVPQNRSSFNLKFVFNLDMPLILALQSRAWTMAVFFEDQQSDCYPKYALDIDACKYNTVPEPRTWMYLFRLSEQMVPSMVSKSNILIIKGECRKGSIVQLSCMFYILHRAGFEGWGVFFPSFEASLFFNLISNWHVRGKGV